MKNLLVVVLLAFAMHLSAQSEVVEIRSGDMNKYIANGAGSSQGLKYIFRYPKSFQAMDDGQSVMFGSKQSKLRIEISVTKAKDDAITPHGKLKAGPTLFKLNGEDWKSADYSEDLKNKVGKTSFPAYFRHRVYTHMHDGYLIIITFTVRSDDSKDAAQVMFDQYQDAFLTEIKTFAVLSDWGK